jgi:hypothetical protein
MDINKELAELLGLCWHEYDHWEGRYQVCRCGVKHFYSDKPVDWANPDFASDSGKIELLRLMMKREDWSKFAVYIWDAEVVINSQVIPQVAITIIYITNTTGRLAQAAVEFLKGQNKFKQIETEEAQSI